MGNRWGNSGNSDRLYFLVKELEEMQQRLQEALQLEVKARQDEEAVRLAQTR